MAKMRFREPTLRNEKRKALAGAVLQTIKAHEDHGISRVTSRQLYYRLVAANLVPNEERAYKMVTGLLADMRYWGLIDWDFIVDMGREPVIPREFADINDLAEAAIRSLRYDRWAGQDNYVEVWVEKQALQSVLEPIGDYLHVPIVVNKGYTSASAMYESARRIRRKGGMSQRRAVVLYFGDLDPSGEDMLRDITDRLAEFGANPTIRKIGLTLAQVGEHGCPPNPAKSTDSRFEGFRQKMADNEEYLEICKAQGLDSSETYSWELDSLPVEVLSTLVRETVEEFITDREAVEAVIEQEAKDKDALVKAAKAIADGEFE
jgi:hypothetical protein